MSTGGRIVVLVAVIALAIAGFVVASGSDEDGSGSDTTTSTAATETTDTSATATGEAETTETDTAETEAEPKPRPRPRSTRIVVAGGQPQGGVKRIRAEKGDRIRLIVQSDVADHIHVHGYDLFKDIAPGQNARFDFRARIEGVFEIELENRGVQIASLRVEP